MRSWCFVFGGIGVGFAHWISGCARDEEVLGHWPQIVTSFGSTGQQQEYQMVHGIVSSWSLILWYDGRKVFSVNSVFTKFVVGTSV